MSLTKKIDFALILKVTNANPNGDPLNGNRPRADFQGFGEMTDVCLKRKIRDYQQGSGDMPSNEKNRRHNQPCQPRKRQKCRLGRERVQCPEKPTKTTLPKKPAENG